MPSSSHCLHFNEINWKDYIYIWKNLQTWLFSNMQPCFDKPWKNIYGLRFYLVIKYMKAGWKDGSRTPYHSCALSWWNVLLHASPLHADITQAFRTEICPQGTLVLRPSGYWQHLMVAGNRCMDHMDWVRLVTGFSTVHPCTRTLISIPLHTDTYHNFYALDYWQPFVVHTCDSLATRRYAKQQP